MSNNVVEIVEYFNKETGKFQREKPSLPSKRFIKIPLDWYEASMLVGRLASSVGVSLWRLSFIRKSRTFKVTNSFLSEYGVNRQQKSRALQQLEDAGLIAVERTNRKSPVVTLLDPCVHVDR